MNRVQGCRARFLLVTAVLVGVAAACQPVTGAPPAPQPVEQACVASPPVSPAEFQGAFDHLRLTFTGWASADGAIPIALPDGRTVWLFGDTYVGRVDPGGAIAAGAPIVHNSFVVQSGACFAPLMGGSPLARTSLIPNPSADQWYWPASGVVDGSVLRVFLWHLQSTGTGAPLDFTALDMRMATFSLPSLTLQSIATLPFTNPSRPYGATAMSGPGPDGVDLYLYGTNQRNDYVTRVPLGQETNPSAWRFWAGTAWVADPAAATPMAWAGVPPLLPALGSGAGPAAQPWVVSYGSGFLATSKSADGFSDDVTVFTAPSPSGPWTGVEQIANTNASDVQAYGAFLLGADSQHPVVAYSVNTTFDSSPPPPSISNFGVQFVAPTVSLPAIPALSANRTGP